jgi:DNA-binding beta-propeller fold protein YncE
MLVNARARRALRASILIVVTTAATLVPAQGAFAAWSAPTFVRSIGGPGEARVYAWGMEWNPITNEILVGDYWNYQIRRYDTSGHELGAFYRPASIRKGQPYTIEVDDRNGDIWVPEIGNTDLYKGYIAHYDKTGTYLGEIKVNASYWAWIAVDGKFLYVAAAHNSHSPKILKIDLDTGLQVASWGTFGTGPGQFGNELHGIDTDADGNVYVADADRRMVHVFTADGVWLRDFGSKGTAVGQFTGDLRGLSIDPANGWVYVVDAEASEVEKFTLAGTPLGHFGSEGAGPGQFADGGRESTVDGDGHLWVADFGNFRFFEYGANGSLLGTYPDPAQGPAPGGFAEVRDVAVDPVNGDVWGADAWNNRFQKFSSDGTFLGAWGVRNSHPPYGMDYPRGVGVDPATRNVWVADTREHVIRVYSRLGAYLFSVGSGADSGDPGSFRLPMDIEFFGGKVYVGDYGQLYGGGPNACKLKILSAVDGQELSAVDVCHNGLAIDPATGNLYVVSWITDVVKVFDPNGVLLFQFGSPGTGAGQFQYAWDADIVNGTLYVTDSNLRRIQAFSLDGTLLGSFGAKGQRAGQFDAPSGITHDAAGLLYIADATNDRIVVMNPNLAKPAGDVTASTVSITGPASGTTVAAVSPAVITGAVSDNVAVGTVEVTIRDRVNGRWWNAKLAKWQGTRSWNLTATIWTSRTQATWRCPFVGIDRGGSYQVTARAIDLAGNITPGPLPNRNFTVAA